MNKRRNTVSLSDRIWLWLDGVITKRVVITICVTALAICAMITIMYDMSQKLAH